MLCSAEELGFEDKVVPVAHKDGIWILEGDYEPGSDFAEALGLRQAVVDFEITPNRPDCLSMVGMAREAAATFKKQFTYPDIEIRDENGKGESADYVSVDIRNPESCKRYVARIVTDVKVEQSPWWLQKRLMYAGMRPINNIVDITNFVMLEYGQPIHAFDINQVKGGTIIVENAEEGEKFVTLDENERTLTKDMLLIKDAERGIAIAGVMAMHPKCIILDEPTAMLDPNGRKEVLRAVKELNEKEGITVVLITHYMEEVVNADKVFVMDQGKVVMQGTPREVFSRVEELKSYRLDVPQVTLLAYELKQAGVKIPAGILTTEELVNALCQ